MPNEWQSEFVALLEELDEAIDWRPKEGRYWVQLSRQAGGRYVADPLMDYERGRRRLEHKKSITTMPAPKPLVQLHAKVGSKLAEIETIFERSGVPMPNITLFARDPANDKDDDYLFQRKSRTMTFAGLSRLPWLRLRQRSP